MRVFILTFMALTAFSTLLISQDFKLNETFKVTSDLYGGSLLTDINADGFADILYADRREVYLLINKGNSILQFDKIKLALDQSIGKSFQVWDLDADGDLDILMGVSGKISQFVNKSTQDKIEFEKVTKDFLFFGNQSTSVPVFKVGYINQDSLYDVVIAYGKTKLLLQKPDKSFFEYEIPNSVYSGVKNVEIADLDGDNKSDLIFCRNGGANQTGLYFYLNSNNSFNLEQTLINDGINDFVVSDFNSDGKTDILTLNYTLNSSLLLFYNTGTQNIFKLDTVLTNITNSYKSISIGNLDDKKGLDIAIGFEESAGIDILNNNGSEDQSWIRSSLLGSFGKSEKIFVRDLDGDKDDDILQMLGDDGFLIYERLPVPSSTNDVNVNIEVFPNPCTSLLNIKIKNIISYVKIRDIYGNLLLDQNNRQSEYMVIDMDQFSSGYYLIEVKDINNEIFRSKIVKIK